MQSNMLTSKKVKLHGMQSVLWGTKDKISQYKGLVNLYARDKKIFDSDTNLARRKFRKETRRLRNEISDKREQLDNAVRGDRQMLRNALTDYRDLQLAYQNMHPTKVIDVLNQENFLKRKEMDRMNYKMKQKTEELIKLKLEYAELEDRLKYESLDDKIPVEEQAQIITAQVQEAIMKGEAACDVRMTYCNILTILEKDAIYFDAVLAALHIDGFNQGKCIIKVTEMGQLATEYLDDKKDEYRQLERALKKSMKKREKSLQEIRDQLDFLNNNVKYLIRRDSVIELDGERKSRHTYSESHLISSINSIEEILNKLKTATVVAKIEDIFPRMEDQIKQMIRLQNLVNKNTESRDKLMNKSRHAEQMYNNLCHTMVETTFWYKEEKVRLNDAINEIIKGHMEITDTIARRGHLAMKIRTSLQQLAEMLRNVVGQPPPVGGGKKKVTKKKPGVKEKKMKGVRMKGKKKEKGERGMKGKPMKLKEAKEVKAIVKPKEEGKKEKPKKKKGVKIDEDADKSRAENSTELLELITERLQVLVTTIGTDELDAARRTVAENMFQTFVDNMTDKSHILDTQVGEESLIADLQLEDPQVPSRAEIKARSEEICEKNAKTEFDVPVLTVKKL